MGAARWQALVELRPFLVFLPVATRQVHLGQGIARLQGEQQACSLGTAQRRPQLFSGVFFWGGEQSQARKSFLGLAAHERSIPRVHPGRVPAVVLPQKQRHVGQRQH